MKLSTKKLYFFLSPKLSQDCFKNLQISFGIENQNGPEVLTSWCASMVKCTKKMLPYAISIKVLVKCLKVEAKCCSNWIFFHGDLYYHAKYSNIEHQDIFKSDAQCKCFQINIPIYKVQVIKKDNICTNLQCRNSLKCLFKLATW